MSSDSRTDMKTETTKRVRFRDWQAGAIGGLIGGVIMGVILWMMQPAVITGAIAGMYTLQGALIGWVAHLVHSVIFGVIFAAILSLPVLTRYADTVWPSAILGLIYGAILWVVAAGLVMPVWLMAVGFPVPPPFPNWTLPGSLVPHLVYGVVLGGTYPLLRHRGE